MKNVRWRRQERGQTDSSIVCRDKPNPDMRAITGIRQSYIRVITWTLGIFNHSLFQDSDFSLFLSKTSLKELNTNCFRNSMCPVQATTEIDSLFDGIGFSFSLSKARFEELNIEYFRNSMCSVQANTEIDSLFEGIGFFLSTSKETNEIDSLFNGMDFSLFFSKARSEKLKTNYFRNSMCPVQATTEIDSLLEGIGFSLSVSKETNEIDSFFEGVDFSPSLSKTRFKELNMDNFRNCRCPMQASIEIDSLFEGIGFSFSLSKARCEELNMDYFRNSMCPLQVTTDFITKKCDWLLGPSNREMHAMHGNHETVTIVSANMTSWARHAETVLAMKAVKA